MKRMNMRSFFSGILVALILVGLIGSAAATVGTRTIDVDYNNIRIKVDNNILYPVDVNGNFTEPLAINGTVYLPIRAIGSALDMDVAWDSKESMVIMTSKENTLSLYYEETTVPKFDFVAGDPIHNFSMEDGVLCYVYDLDLPENGDFPALKVEYADLLKKFNFSQTYAGDIDGDKFYNFKNSKTQEEVILGEYSASDGSRSAQVFITPASSNSTSNTVPSSSSQSSSSQSPSSPEPSDSSSDISIPDVCPTCDIAWSLYQRQSDGTVIMRCRNPSCSQYNRNVYFAP